VNLPATAVLMGGISPEREVSLASGRNVAAGLKEVGCPLVVEVEILPDRLWRIEGERSGRPFRVIETLLKRGVECFFLALHGEGGEDGSIQGFFETLGLPYTGSGVSSSALAMSKSATRAVLKGQGIPVAPGVEIRNPGVEEIRRAVEDDSGFPCFLKEDFSGSSLGVHLLKGPPDLDRVLPLIVESRLPLVVEKVVPGKEVTVAVLGDGREESGDLLAFPPVEIRPKKLFFDYQAKYDPEWTEEICPPRSLSKAEQDDLCRLARRVHRVLGCRGVSRTDFIMGSSGPVVLECNTIPGLTKESLLPKAARAAGVDFPGLLARLVRMAMGSGR